MLAFDACHWAGKVRSGCDFHLARHFPGSVHQIEYLKVPGFLRRLLRALRNPKKSKATSTSQGTLYKIRARGFVQGTLSLFTSQPLRNIGHLVIERWSFATWLRLTRIIGDVIECFTELIQVIFSLPT